MSIVKRLVLNQQNFLQVVNTSLTHRLNICEPVITILFIYTTSVKKEKEPYAHKTVYLQGSQFANGSSKNRQEAFISNVNPSSTLLGGV